MFDYLNAIEVLSNVLISSYYIKVHI